MAMKDKTCFVCQKTAREQDGDIVCLYVAYPFMENGSNKHNVICPDCVLMGAKRIGKVNTAVFSYWGLKDHVWNEWGTKKWMRSRVERQHRMKEKEDVITEMKRLTL